VKLDEFAMDNVDYKEIQGEKILDWKEKSYRNPDDFISNDKHSVGLSYEKYVKAIDSFPKNYFDIVLVDGRARNCCIKRAMAHVKEEGYLVVDNTDRRYYLEGFTELQDSSIWEKSEFQGPVFFQHAFNKTSFFKKKKG
jgi:hypothetical protein